MKLSKKDIENVCKENEISDIDFDRWIAYEHSQLLTCKEDNEVYHRDIISILEHLQKVYEKGTKEELYIKTTIEDCLEVAHYQAMDEDYRNRTRCDRFNEFVWSYDIFFLIRDTRAYLQNQLSWKIYNKYYDF